MYIVLKLRNIFIFFPPRHIKIKFKKLSILDNQTFYDKLLKIVTSKNPDSLRVLGSNDSETQSYFWWVSQDTHVYEFKKFFSVAKQV